MLLHVLRHRKLHLRHLGGAGGADGDLGHVNVSRGAERRQLLADRRCRVVCLREVVLRRDDARAAFPAHQLLAGDEIPAALHVHELRAQANAQGQQREHLGLRALEGPALLLRAHRVDDGERGREAQRRVLLADGAEGGVRKEVDAHLQRVRARLDLQNVAPGLPQVLVGEGHDDAALEEGRLLGAHHTVHQRAQRCVCSGLVGGGDEELVGAARVVKRLPARPRHVGGLWERGARGV
mmetsp:Transcript_10942/g.26575  ORF Transcript_10942/g.26575 Transcript_10942/m.26575 type:complete len:238 (-) Transcript_10942:2874-3587(-)